MTIHSNEDLKQSTEASQVYDSRRLALWSLFDQLVDCEQKRLQLLRILYEKVIRDGDEMSPIPPFP